MGYVLIGVGVGLVGLVGTLVLGHTLVGALLAYMAMGAATTLLLPVLAYALHRLRGGLDEEWLADCSDDRVVDLPALGSVCAPATEVVALVPELTVEGTTALAYEAPFAVAAEAGTTILAVDDDPFILELIPKLAAQADYHDVVTVASAGEALALLERTTTAFKCILLDIQMPGMDGIELCSRIRGMDMYRKTPVVMLTAKSEHSYLEQAFKAGATDYITKPFDVTGFSTHLRTVIEAPAAEVSMAHARIVPKKVVGRMPSAGTGQSPSTDAARLIASGNFIDLNALSNYLTRLSGAALVRSVVVAVQVEGIAELQKTLTPHRLQHVLEEVASAIDRLLGGERYVGAYAGKGQFVIVCSRDAIENISNTEADLQYMLDRRLDDDTLGLTQSVSVLVGATVRPRTPRVSRARDSIGTALDLVDARAEYVRGVHIPRLGSGQGTISG